MHPLREVASVRQTLGIEQKSRWPPAGGHHLLRIAEAVTVRGEGNWWRNEKEKKRKIKCQNKNPLLGEEERIVIWREKENKKKKMTVQVRRDRGVGGLCPFVFSLENF